MSVSPTLITVELLRAHGYPQKDTDPQPCTTQIEASCYLPPLQPTGTAQLSAVQPESNDPFYKDTLRLEAPAEASVGSATVVLRVLELSRQPAPVAVLHGVIADVPLSKDLKPREVIVPLTVADPVADAEAAAAERLRLLASAEPYPTLAVRWAVRRGRAVAAASEDAHADVAVLRESVCLAGDTALVPAETQYVWLRLLGDKKFAEGYRSALCSCWTPLAPLKTAAEMEDEKGAGGAAAAAGGKKTKSVSLPPAPLMTVADVVTRRWFCRRSHEILTRVRLTAEKYARDSRASLNFSREAERAYRLERKSRTFLLADLCDAALGIAKGKKRASGGGGSMSPFSESLDATATATPAATGSSGSGGGGLLAGVTAGTGSTGARDWLHRLWVLYSTGVDNDPSGARQPSYEVRKRALDYEFTTEDAVILQAALLRLLVPSLDAAYCMAVAESDLRAEPLPAVKEKSNFDGTDRVSAGQRGFTHVLVWFAGPLAETLTDAEVVRLCRALRPAVQEAHDTVAKGGKDGVRERREAREAEGGSGAPRFHTGDGIKITHLDKYGNRKKTTKYA